VVDITERKQLEEQLRQSQKMEAIGRLAGGVAHDFNNLLTVIIGYTEFLLSSYLNSADPRQGEVEQIRRAGERAALLTRQLLAFSRQQPLQPQLLNLSQIVANMEEMLRRLIGEDITLITDLASEAGYVRADPGQIEQIIMNLVVNARDAMPQGGRLIIGTTHLELDKLEAGIYGVKPGPQVVLLVSDTGLGMNPEIKSRIFEPFFTTKGTGKGTGLGLAMVYGIIEQSGGHIRVESAPEQGATFKIYLPKVEPPTKPPRPSTLVSSSSMESNKTILLVEDEAAVRLITRKFLQTRGYKVLEAGHAREALDLCQQHQGRIDLLITDVVMPEINGPELAGQLARLYPSLKVLYISGYSDDILDQYEIAASNLNLLEKPFSSEGLILKVGNLLAQVDDNSP
jgi:nitrogen-specific signal transduction histidine kinase